MRFLLQHLATELREHFGQPNADDADVRMQEVLAIMKLREAIAAFKPSPVKCDGDCSDLSTPREAAS